MSGVAELKTNRSRPEGSGTSASSTITLSVTPGMMETLQQLTRDSHRPLEDVLTRAISLYKASLAAVSENKHVGFAASADGLEVEFTGIAGPTQ